MQLIGKAVHIFAAEDPDTEQKSRVTYAVAENKVAIKKFTWRKVQLTLDSFLKTKSKEMQFVLNTAYWNCVEFHEIRYWNVYRNLLRKFKVSKNWAEILGTIHKDLS